MGEHCAVNEWSLQELATELLASAKEVSSEFGPWPDFEAAAERASRELAAKDREIAEMRAKLAASESSDAESIAMYRTTRDDRDESRRHLGELLAVIHRDGGQYQAEHGAAKAVADALTVVVAMRTCIENLREVVQDAAKKVFDHRLATQQAESERDEARECVKWLCDSLRIVADRTKDGADYVTLTNAIAATPEHLRNG